MDGMVGSVYLNGGSVVGMLDHSRQSICYFWMPCERAGNIYAGFALGFAVGGFHGF